MPKKKRRRYDRTCGTERRVIRNAPRCPGCNTPLLAAPTHPNPLVHWECVFCDRYFTDPIRTGSGGQQ